MEYPGKIQKRGSEGAAVKAIQKALGVQQTGIFGPTTEECVTAFQRSRGLDPDGEVGKFTWAALFAPVPASGDLGEAALKEARARIGVREKPLGSNRGQEVDSYNQRSGAPPGSFWCMSFVYFCVDEASKKLGKANPLPKTASCSKLYNWAKANGRLTSRPEPGDVFLCIGGDTGHFHTGFVDRKPFSERFATVEGNSNDEGSSNGIEVAHRLPGRRLASCHYVRL